MSRVWSGGDLLGREAAFSPLACYERAQNKCSRAVAKTMWVEISVVVKKSVALLLAILK